MANDKPLNRVISLPREEVLSVTKGSVAHTGRAMAITLAGEDVIVIARNLPQLDIVFNYIEAHMCGGRAHLMRTLRTEACPEVAVTQRNNLKYDDEL